MNAAQGGDFHLVRRSIRRFGVSVSGTRTVAEGI